MFIVERLLNSHLLQEGHQKLICILEDHYSRILEIVRLKSWLDMPRHLKLPRESQPIMLEPKPNRPDSTHNPTRPKKLKIPNPDANQNKNDSTNPEIKNSSTPNKSIPLVSASEISNAIVFRN